MTTYSHSRLSTFEQCKYKFKLRYIDKVPALIPDTVETFLGSRVHDTLEKLYKDLKFQKKPTKGDLINFLEKEWKKKWSYKILIVRDEYTPDNYLDMAKKFVSDYYDHYHPFDQATCIGTEIHVKIKLDKKGKFLVQGYIDRLDSKGSTYEIHDYKTAKDIPIQEYLDKDRQLALYAIAVREQYRDSKEVKLIWHYLAFDKELQSKRTDKQLEELKKEVIEIIKDIEACRDFPTKTSALCDWCEYRQMCPEWKHLYEVEKRKEEKNLGEDHGLKLVNQYSKLKEKESELKKEIQELHEKILLFADKKNINTVFGDEQKAKIWSRECDKFPKTTDYNYVEFVEAVKKLGIWNEFSRLDTFKLEKAFENKEFFDEIMESLRKFAKKEKIERIYLSKK